MIYITRTEKYNVHMWFSLNKKPVKKSDEKGQIWGMVSYEETDRKIIHNTS